MRPELGRALMQDGADNSAMLEVIRQLAQSVQGMQTGQTQLVERQTEILERLARIEAGKTHEEVAKLEVRVNNHSDRLAALERVAALEEGGVRTRKAFLSYWGPLSWTIGILALVLWTLARATGVIHLPDDPSGYQRVEKTEVREHEQH